MRAVGLRGELKLYPLLDFHEPLLGSPFLVWEDGSPAAGVPAPHHERRVLGADDQAAWAAVTAADAMIGRELGFLAASYLDPAFPKPSGGLPFRWLGREVVTVGGEMVGHRGRGAARRRRSSCW